MAKPAWLKIRPCPCTDFSKIRTTLRKHGLSTVCEEANCPNMAECWHNEGTATFMVMGDVCTRACAFCATKSAKKGMPLDPDEPAKLAKAISEMELDYAVITSVDRDDLADGGAGHFAKCIKNIKNTHIEVLIPDYTDERLQVVVKAGPHVIAHNIETVRPLQRRVRDRRADYDTSLKVLRQVKEFNQLIFTKSGIMLGLGETKHEVIQAMKDLREVGCNILTFGQYLRPKNKSLPVVEYVHPDVFEEYKRIGEQMGFLYVASGPFVRSSYRAGELFLRKEVIPCQGT